MWVNNLRSALSINSSISKAVCETPRRWAFRDIAPISCSQRCNTTVVLLLSLFYISAVIGVTHTQESGTRNVHKFLKCVSCFLVRVFFWYKFLAPNRTQLYFTLKKRACRWPKLCGLIGRLCFFLALSVAFIVSHVCCASCLNQKLVWTCIKFSIFGTRNWRHILFC